MDLMPSVFQRFNKQNIIRFLHTELTTTSYIHGFQEDELFVHTEDENDSDRPNVESPSEDKNDIASEPDNGGSESDNESKTDIEASNEDSSPESSSDSSSCTGGTNTNCNNGVCTVTCSGNNNNNNNNNGRVKRTAYNRCVVVTEGCLSDSDCQHVRNGFCQQKEETVNNNVDGKLINSLIG